MRTTRREFLAGLAGAAAFAQRGRPGDEPDLPELGYPAPGRFVRGDSSVGAALRAGARVDLGRAGRPRAGLSASPLVEQLRLRFRDFPRHFAFEYYPWYATDPYLHWDEADRTPPLDIASNYMPALGAYDSRSARVVEQHARWIASAGVGAINLSWWGQGSFPDRAVPLVMDVMREHGIHVAFHLEPYGDGRAGRYAADILYLIREYGERRRWDCLLLLENADGASGPVFKSFRTILPRQSVDCHGVTHVVRDFVEDADWHRQTDAVRETLRPDFDHVTLLADSLDVRRTRAAGFDGISIYDNYVRPESWGRHALACTEHDLLFSFNVNPGFDGIVLRRVRAGSCYRPPRFEPGGEAFDWSSPHGREGARELSEARIDESFNRTLRLQNHRQLSNAARGFLLVYLNSFNEWHEGHQFEPMRNFADLLPAERAFGYHNPNSGDYRLRRLRSYLAARPAAGTPDAAADRSLPV